MLAHHAKVEHLVYGAQQMVSLDYVVEIELVE